MGVEETPVGPCSGGRRRGERAQGDSGGVAHRLLRRRGQGAQRALDCPVGVAHPLGHPRGEEGREAPDEHGLDKVFPEFAAQFSDPFGATGRELLGRCAGAAEFAALDLGDLAATIRRASRHQLGRAKAEAVHAAAQDSLGVGCLERVARLEVRALLAQLRLLERQCAQVDARLQRRLARAAPHLLTVPGVRGVLAATILAELGDVGRFGRVEEVVAFAGLDASVFESRDFQGTRQHISKRGSPYLRRALYLAAFKAVETDPELAAFLRRKQAEGKPYRVALVAVSRKLLARVYRVLRDGLPYQPAPSAPETAASDEAAQDSSTGGPQ
ncbi:MAG TPA: transposase, partial [Chloroflexota bacterium]|nr:transposase [Chloroflexota bacterium]